MRRLGQRQVEPLARHEDEPSPVLGDAVVRDLQHVPGVAVIQSLQRLQLHSQQLHGTTLRMRRLGDVAHAADNEAFRLDREVDA